MVRKKPATAPSIFGKGQPVAKKFLLQAIRSDEAQVRLEFEKSQKTFTKRVLEERKFMATFEEGLRRLGIDLEVATADIGAALRRDYEGALKRHPEPPRFLKASPFSFVGSHFVCRTPPYDLEGSGELGNASTTRSASKASGQMSFEISSDPNQISVGEARAAIGIYFRAPAILPGILDVFTAVAYGAHWGTWSRFESAHTEGWIGLYAAAFNASDNSFAGVALNQKLLLFTQDAHFLRPAFSLPGDKTESNPALPLHASLHVGGGLDYWYAIVVRCGGYTSAAGWSGEGGIRRKWGSAAHSGLHSVNVPYICLSYTYPPIG